MTELFDVAVTGQLLPNKNREQVIVALAAKFAMDATKAAYLLNGKQLVVKKGVNSQTAQQFRDMLIEIGADAIVVPQGMGNDTMTPQPASMMATQRIMSQPKSAAVAAQRGYKFKVEGEPEYAFVTVELPASGMLKVEASAMATMDTNISMRTKLRGGLGRFVTGESIFMNEFIAQGGPGHIGIAPGAPGDVRHVYLNSETIYLQNSAFLAASAAVAVESKWQGLMKGFFSGESLFLIRCQGKGDLWFNSYGGIIEIDVTDNYVVDTGNIVAFTDGLTYEVTKIGGYKSLFFSGEGFVCRFKGNGKVWIQTRKVEAFARWAWPFRPAKE